MKTITDVKTALLTVTQNVRHYSYPNPPADYIVYAEDMQSDALHGAGTMRNQTLEGTVDYFTKSLNSNNAKAVQNALLSAGIPFRCNSIQYEPSTGYLHFEWIIEIESHLLEG